MTIISLILAVDRNQGLGKDNQLLCHLPADLQYFKQLTLGKPIIMGRKTYESIGKPLPGRLNIVVSRHSFSQEGIVVVSSIEEALVQAGDAPEIMVIGGANIFVQYLPFANKIYLTQIEHTFAADVFFPPLDEKKWHCVAETAHPADAKNPYPYRFLVYELL